MFDLKGKVAIVTGGAGGLGRPISIGLAQAGADVVVDDLEKANPQAVVDEIKKQGGKGLAVSYDVTDTASMEKMVNQVKKEFGQIDILVNVAGINARFPAEEMPPEEYEKVVRFNTLGTFLPCQVVGKAMIEQITS
jgi:NAD(P)-dependent dehydrogenase (short-subunit alcohol dehydrogenase family)